MRYPVFICDDDPEQIAQVTATLKRAEQILSDEEKICFDLASQGNYQDAKAHLLSHPADGGIYFLDVELGQEVDADNGFDLAELIKKQDDRAQIIFLTSHADLSIITYRRRLGPVDYIVKGADPMAQRRRIVETVEVALDQLHKDSVAKQLTFSYRVGRQPVRQGKSPLGENQPVLPGQPGQYRSHRPPPPPGLFRERGCRRVRGWPAEADEDAHAGA
jgi:two-component system response regulator AgrA